jgi:hypothetical protein
MSQQADEYVYKVFTFNLRYCRWRNLGLRLRLPDNLPHAIKEDAMPYFADMKKLEDLKKAKKLVGTGQCVALVQAVSNIPKTTGWRQGDAVKDNKSIQPGTIIGTFDEKTKQYGNHTDGTSHAAIFLYQSTDGIVVVDQWKGRRPAPDHPPQPRTIYFNRSRNEKVDQGEEYYVVQ